MRALDLPLDALPQEPPATATERAQAVRCGERWLAFPHGWARSAVDQVQLSAVPGSPAWLAGAVNVEGSIVPVVDLLAWAEPGRFIDAQGKEARLLVGGEGDDAVAFLFEGMPRLVDIARAGRAPGGGRLDPYLIGHGVGDDPTVALDAPALVQTLIDELALH